MREKTAVSTVVDVSFINPFIGSVGSVFTTMLNLNPKRSKLVLADGALGNESLSALVGLSGELSGVVALRFPPATALKVAGIMLDAEYTEIDDHVIDAISELVNMVAGSAKAQFDFDPPLQLGLPTVVEGRGYKLKYPSKSVWLDVPFACEAGDFSMEFTYIPN